MLYTICANLFCSLRSFDFCSKSLRMLGATSKTSLVTKIFPSVFFLLSKYLESWIFSLKLRKFTMIVVFFISCAIISLYFSIEMSSSTANFSLTKSVMILSLLPHISLVSSWNPLKWRFFQWLRSSKSASFLFVFVTKSSVIWSNWISCTFLWMCSSFLTILSTFSLSVIILKYQFSCAI